MRRSTLSVFVGLMVFAHSGLLGAEEFVWMEGEATGSANVKANRAGWGRKEFLSGEQWLHLAIDADKIDKQLPAEGARFRYPFQIQNAGAYEVWNRVGFEFARSPFEWRIDGDDWKTVGPDALTTDLMEVDFFCEVA